MEVFSTRILCNEMQNTFYGSMCLKIVDIHVLFIFSQLDEIDLVCASLENAIGTIGGFCAGKAYVVDHQVRYIYIYIVQFRRF